MKYEAAVFRVLTTRINMKVVPAGRDGMLEEGYPTRLVTAIGLFPGRSTRNLSRFPNPNGYYFVSRTNGILADSR